MNMLRLVIYCDFWFTIMVVIYYEIYICDG